MDTQNNDDEACFYILKDGKRYTFCSQVSLQYVNNRDNKCPICGRKAQDFYIRMPPYPERKI